MYPCKEILAQDLKPGQKGLIVGAIKDSVTLQPIPSATVSIYRTTDTTLVAYVLSNEKGDFTFNNSPLDTTLVLVVSYVGYKSSRQKIRLGPAQSVLNLGVIQLAEAPTSLKEVSIYKAPVEVRGDTIEFNADFFKTKTNAVVGDLLNILPGLIIWGDGTMTVNGKPVNKILVDGKVFFSGDLKVATDNLPKNIVDKIQVYADRSTQSPGDSTRNLTMDIKLKKGKNKGIFGKLGMGMGSDRRYQGDLMLAGFSARSQMSIVGTSNNINKNALSLGQMMLNNTFSPNATSATPNESDFSLPGRNQLSSLGAQHSLEWRPGKQNKAEYQWNQSDSKINRSSTSTLLLPDSTINRESAQNQVQKNTSNRFSESFQWQNKEEDIVNVGVQLRESSSLISDDNTYRTESSSGLLLNHGEKSYLERSNQRAIALQISYSHIISPLKSSMPKPENFAINYKLDRDIQDSERKVNSSLFGENFDPVELFRTSNVGTRAYRQELNTDYFSIPELFKIHIPHFNAVFKNQITHQSRVSNVLAEDFENEFGASGRINKYLSNVSHYHYFIERPSLEASRTYSHTLANRYVKLLIISLIGKYHYSFQNNSSDQAVLNLRKRYAALLPAAKINYSNRQIDRHETNVELEYHKDIEVPSIDKLVKLIDSTEQTSLVLGNSKLKESKIHNLQFRMDWRQYQKTGMKIELEANSTAVADFQGESSAYNAISQRVSQPVNLEGFREQLIKSIFSKPFILGKTMITAVSYGSYRFHRYPFLFENQKNFSRTQIISYGTSLSYNMNQKFSANFSANRRKNVSWIEGEESRFITSLTEINCHVLYNISDRLKIASYQQWQMRQESINSIRNNFLICNLTLAYRMGKGNQFELKCSANDLFKQNNGIVFLNNANSITTERVDRLQRYGLFSFAYFPRKFVK